MSEIEKEFKMENRAIGEVVAEDYRTATVFKSYNIDFCCQGGRSIAEACAKKGVSIWELLKDLEEAQSKGLDPAVDFKAWPLDVLVNYIEQRHHKYVEKRSIEIKPFLDKLCRVHGERHPELLEINGLFSTAISALSQHMKKEELVLFPYVLKMVKSEMSGEPIKMASFGEVHNPIGMMEYEHDAEGERFREISRLSNNYQCPPDGCNTYQVTFALLKEFEDDLHLHIHLENNILFPAAKQLEDRLKSQGLIEA